jgi:hypothetical protein
MISLPGRGGKGSCIADSLVTAYRRRIRADTFPEKMRIGRLSVCFVASKQSRPPAQAGS